MMKVLSSLTILFAALSLACQQQEMPKTEAVAEEAAVATVLDNYVKAVENEDMVLYSSLMSHDSTMVNFGVFGGPIRGWTGLEQVIGMQFDSLSNVKVAVSDVSIHVTECPNRAWAISLWQFSAMKGETALNFPVRCTWILNKEGGRWLIVHFHKSIAAG